MLLLALEEKYFEAMAGHKFPYYPDLLDPEVAKEFINLTHHWYEEHFKKYFGTVIKGIFTDNSAANYGFVRRAIPWSVNFEERFGKSTQQELKKLLPGLFFDFLPGASLARLLFWRFVGDEFLRSFILPIKKFCQKK